MSEGPRVAVFRPDDERLEAAVDILDSLGATPVSDPMLAVEPTGAVPNKEAFVVFTSKTGVELAAESGWNPETAASEPDISLVAIGPATAKTARDAGWAVDVIPEQYTSQGLVDALTDRVEGRRVEVARSDHGSPVLLDGLRQAGAIVNETILYRLVRPPAAGDSAELAAQGRLDGAAFTSSLTVEHFLEAAEDRGIRQEAIEGLNRSVVGTIGNPTRETAESLGVDVDVVPAEATFDSLATTVIDAVTARSTTQAE